MGRHLVWGPREREQAEREWAARASRRAMAEREVDAIPDDERRDAHVQLVQDFEECSVKLDDEREKRTYAEGDLAEAMRDVEHFREKAAALANELDVARAEVAALMSKTRRARLLEFHKAMGVPAPTKPCVPSDERVRLRLRLIAEEFFELLRSVESGIYETACTHCLENTEFAVRHYIDQVSIGIDMPAMVDALADIDYVVEGCRVEFGIDGEPIEAAVHAANMAKVGGTMREDGKILKPKDWRPPDVAGALKQQGWSAA